MSNTIEYPRETNGDPPIVWAETVLIRETFETPTSSGPIYGTGVLYGTDFIYGFGGTNHSWIKPVWVESSLVADNIENADWFMTDWVDHVLVTEDFESPWP